MIGADGERHDAYLTPKANGINCYQNLHGAAWLGSLKLSQTLLDILSRVWGNEEARCPRQPDFRPSPGSLNHGRDRPYIRPASARTRYTDATPIPVRRAISARCKLAKLQRSHLRHESLNLAFCTCGNCEPRISLRLKGVVGENVMSIPLRLIAASLFAMPPSQRVPAHNANIDPRPMLN